MARAAGYFVVDLDDRPSVGASITADILEWDYAAAFAPGDFDAIWFSPPCRFMSQSRLAGAATAAELAESDAILQRVLEIIAYFRPHRWWVENPWGGSDTINTRPPLALGRGACAIPTGVREQSTLSFAKSVAAG